MKKTKTKKTEVVAVELAEPLPSLMRYMVLVDITDRATGSEQTVGGDVYYDLDACVKAIQKLVGTQAATGGWRHRWNSVTVCKESTTVLQTYVYTPVKFEVVPPEEIRELALRLRDQECARYRPSLIT